MPKLYLAIIKNRIDATDILPAVNKFKDWLKRNTPLEPEISYFNGDFEPKFKVFVPKWQGGQDAYGLDGMKKYLRTALKIPANTYHAVIFLNGLNKPDWAYIGNQGSILNYTYINPLYPNTKTAVCEVHLRTFWGEEDKKNFLYKVLTHEIIHGFFFLAWWQGVSPAILKDDMDLYNKDDEVDALDGNRARNLAKLKPYWNLIASPPPAISIMVSLIETLKQAVSFFLKIKKKTLLVKWAEAIKDYEGWFVGSRSQRNNNPGNLKYANWQRFFGLQGRDADGFAVFENYDGGWQALLWLLERAAIGDFQPTYNSEMTLFDFFKVYAPGSDNNDPHRYTLYVASKIGVPPSIQIKDLV